MIKIFIINVECHGGYSVKANRQQNNYKFKDINEALNFYKNSKSKDYVLPTRMRKTSFRTEFSYEVERQPKHGYVRGYSRTDGWAWLEYILMQDL